MTSTQENSANTPPDGKQLSHSCSGWIKALTGDVNKAKVRKSQAKDSISRKKLSLRLENTIKIINKRGRKLCSVCSVIRDRIDRWIPVNNNVDNKMIPTNPKWRYISIKPLWAVIGAKPQPIAFLMTNLNGSIDQGKPKPLPIKGCLGRPPVRRNDHKGTRPVRVEFLFSKPKTKLRLVRIAMSKPMKIRAMRM